MIHRRQFLTATSLLLGAACVSPARGDDPPLLCRPTGQDIEGPFFRAGAPEAQDLVQEGSSGREIELRCQVKGMDCGPVPGASVQLWQANSEGEYDSSGFRYRTELTTDSGGRVTVRTIVPGRYLNGRRYRPAHIHAKVLVPGRPPLTTQLYFAGDPHNAHDPWFDPSRVVQIRRNIGLFDFVV